MAAVDTSGSLRRYVLFQIPGAGLFAIALWYGVEREWLAGRVAVLLWLGWLLKDALFYPALRSAYVPDHNDPGASLRGQRGLAHDTWGRPAREGYVTIGPELWRAVPDENSAPIAAGDAIRVRAVRGLKLVVERIQD